MSAVIGILPTPPSCTHPDCVWLCSPYFAAFVEMMCGDNELDFFGDGRFESGILSDTIEMILSSVVQRVNLAGKWGHFSIAVYYI